MANAHAGGTRPALYRAAAGRAPAPTAPRMGPLQWRIAMNTNKTIRSTATLPTLPTLPKVNATRPCACGCDRLTQRTFAPGHDARLKAVMIRVIRGVMTIDEVRTWGGDGLAKATEAGIKDAQLMKRWNITIEDAAITKTA
jgi:hypothetical protein